MHTWLKLKRFGMDPQILKMFYSCTIESILTGCITTWHGNCSASDRKALQRVVCTAQYITRAKLPDIQDLYTWQCQRKAQKLVKDSSNLSNRLFSLLPHGKQYGSAKSRTKRLLNSFYPQAIRLLNNELNGHPDYLHETPQITLVPKINVFKSILKQNDIARLTYKFPLFILLPNPIQIFIVTPVLGEKYPFSKTNISLNNKKKCTL
jgi:hypothetical protein